MGTAGAIRRGRPTSAGVQRPCPSVLVPFGSRAWSRADRPIACFLRLSRDSFDVCESFECSCNERTHRTHVYSGGRFFASLYFDFVIDIVCLEVERCREMCETTGTATLFLMSFSVNTYIQGWQSRTLVRTSGTPGRRYNVSNGVLMVLYATGKGSQIRSKQVLIARDKCSNSKLLRVGVLNT